MGSLRRWIRAFLVPGLGPFWLFGAAFLDSSFLSLFEVTDFLIVGVGAEDPRRAPLGVLCLTLGSLAGSSILWWIGHRGGEALLAKRFGQARADRARAAFERWGVLVLAIPAILPPPAPLKIFVLAAGVFGCSYKRFAITLTLARAVRYSLWALLGVVYGREASRFFHAFDRWSRTHIPVLAAVVGVLVLAFLIQAFLQKRPKPEP
jgi:membrane protein YqaA with SNARE-associated domain